MIKNVSLLRRPLTTLIPPKIVSSNQIKSAPNARNVKNMVNFYQKLPQGEAPANEVKIGNGLINWYKAKYFDGENASGKPILHLAAAFIIFGYSMDYYLHLRHHKGEASH